MKILGDLASYVIEKISVDTLNTENFVSVDNLLQNKEGKTSATKIPTTGNYTLFKKGDVLVGNIRPYLRKIWQADCSGGASPDVLVIRASHDEMSDFLYAALLSDDFFDYCMQGTKGSKMPRGDKSHILKFKIHDIKNKQKIGKLIASINQKILYNKKINDNLLAYIKLLFMHLFIKKPVNGQLSSLIVEHQKSTIKVRDAKSGQGEYPFFTSGAAIFNWHEPLVAGINCFLNTGGNADVKVYAGSAAYSSDTWCIRGKEGYEGYLYLLLDSMKQELDQKFFQGTGLKHLQKSLLRNHKIYIPDSREAMCFQSIVHPALQIISHKQQESLALQKTRDKLLPLLMNGQATIE